MPMQAHPSQPLALRAVSAQTRRWLLGLTWLLPTALAVVFTALHADRWYIALWADRMLAADVASSGVINAVIVTISTVAIVISAVTLTIAWLLLRSLRRHGLRIEHGELRVETGLYRRNQPLTSLDLGKARSIELDEHPEFKPLLKTSGIRVPGYCGGHFRLRNWQKAFCAIAGRGRVLYLPIRDNGVLLLGCERPDAALRALREAAGV